jgi:hypothetical protein
MRLKNAIAAVGLFVLLLAPAFAASGPVDGPTPPPGTQIECLTVNIDGGQFYHVTLKKPIAADGASLRAAFTRLGQELQFRALLTGEPRVKADGERIVRAALDQQTVITSGHLCYVYADYVCGSDCSGVGCGSIRVPSMK